MITLSYRVGIYNKTDLKQFGEFSSKQNLLRADQLRAMRGSTAVTNIGMQLRYFPFSIRTLLQEMEA
jgi:hypothetical protein